MKKIQVVKTVGGIIISIGIGTIVGNAIKCTTPSSVKTINKVLVAISGFILSSMISDKVTEYTEVKIDETVDQIKKMVREGDLN
jgi:hypothetical protein